MSKIISIRVPEWLLNDIDEEAFSLGLPRSALLVDCYIEHALRALDIEEYLTFMAAEAAEERS